ncbi:MAG: hypothetical protein GY679_01455 [Mycoplasma sp.]|nr:hypothetical protein [Mycoplasma sp.]
MNDKQTKNIKENIEHLKGNTLLHHSWYLGIKSKYVKGSKLFYEDLRAKIEGDSVFLWKELESGNRTVTQERKPGIKPLNAKEIHLLSLSIGSIRKLSFQLKVSPNEIPIRALTRALEKRLIEFKENK